MTNMTQVPAHLLNRASRGVTAAMSQGLGGIPFPYISRGGNRFTFITTDGQKRGHEKLYLDVVIVDANTAVSKMFYEKQYAQGEDQGPPTCHSNDGVSPSASVEKKQCHSCALCPHNVWEDKVSKATGKPTKGKACQDIKKIAVIIPEFNNDMVFQFTVPPGSLKALATYARTIEATSLGSRPAEVSDVITRISFEAGTMGVLEFAPAGFVDERILDIIDDLSASDKTAEIVGRKETVYAPRVMQARAPVQAIAAPTTYVTPSSVDMPGFGRVGHNAPPEPIDEIPEYAPPTPVQKFTTASSVPLGLKEELQKNFGTLELSKAMNLPL